jgi:hypothetical protein
MKVKVQKKNSTKMGVVWHVSMPPGFSCSPTLPCFTSGDCYGLKAYRQYPGSRKAWHHNLDCWEISPDGFMSSIVAQLLKARKAPALFRWFMAGDLPSSEFVAGMYTMAMSFPQTKFLIFTKMHQRLADGIGAMDMAFAALPPNLSVVLSAWSGMEIYNPFNLPIAWMDDGTDDRIPADALPCSGRCDQCVLCWDLKSHGRDVVFKKH